MRGLVAFICFCALTQIASALRNGTVPVYYSRSMNNSSQSAHLYQSRKSKFLPFYTVVRFRNNPCTATGPGALVGTCRLRSECRNIQGVALGKCARLGVCCVVTRNCGGLASSSNNTYFQNPGFPATYGGGAACTLSIAKNRNTVTHVRLDFTVFDLGQPAAATGVCPITDRLSISGADSTTPVICGLNTGQHMWLRFLPDNSAMRIVIDATLVPAFQRTWNILVTQHEERESPPPGCLMYFTGVGGQIRSFNYNTVAPGLPAVGAATRELANLNYQACIRTAAGYCGTSWALTTGSSFSTTGVGSAANGARSTGDACTTDYVTIPKAVDATGLSTDRFCGNGFAPVQSSMSPFVLGVVTNANEGAGITADASNMGFDLTYSQTVC